MFVLSRKHACLSARKHVVRALNGACLRLAKASLFGPMVEELLERMQVAALALCAYSRPRRVAETRSACSR